jgi:hypothetical protein
MQRRIRLAILLATVGVVAFGANAFASAGGQSGLAEIRQVTAKFHDVEVAKAAGYELGYVNGSGTGSSPVASRTPRLVSWATTSSTRP